MLTDELPQEFAAQATLLPLPLRRLICDGANPATVPAAAVVHALRMPVTQFRRARAALAPPADEILLRIPAVLSAKTCARLRTAVDEGAATNPDSVDGLADHQLDCRTMDELARLCGDPDVIETLKALPAQFAADEKRTAARCLWGGEFSSTLSTEGRLRNTDRTSPVASGGLAMSGQSGARYHGRWRDASVFVIHTADTAGHQMPGAPCRPCG